MKKEDLAAFIVDELRGGATRAEVVERVVAMGVDTGESTFLSSQLPKESVEALVDQLYSEIVETAKATEFESGRLIPAVIGGGIASIVGGAVWGGVLVLTGYELGFLAWGIGVLCGFVVLFSAQGHCGLPFQVVAAVASVMGIVIGKYILFYSMLLDMLPEESVAEVSALSLGTIVFFAKNLTVMLGGFDVLWVILAVASAWKIPAGLGVKVSDSQQF